MKSTLNVAHMRYAPPHINKSALQFSLRCVNSSRSAFAAVQFSECFFENASKLSDAAVRFKLNTKVVLCVLFH